MHENIQNKLEEADKSEGYLITITTFNNGELSHFQRNQRFPKKDLLPSVEEIKKLLREGMV